MLTDIGIDWFVQQQNEPFWGLNESKNHKGANFNYSKYYSKDFRLSGFLLQTIITHIRKHFFSLADMCIFLPLKILSKIWTEHYK